MMMRCSMILTLVAGFAAVAAPCVAEGWGTIKGKFVLKGEAPEIEPLLVTKDQVCIEAKPKNNSLVLGEGNSLANVLVYLKPARGKAVDVHPDYAAQLDEPVTLDNKGCEFVPHVTLVRTGQEFIIANSDPTGHNTNATLRNNGSFNVLIAANEKRPMKLTKEESIPLPVACNIHAFMKGYVLVKEDPYMAVTADDGTFEIKNIPAGKHDFIFWHERKGYLGDLKYKGGKSDRRGKSELTIVADEVSDLGTIEVPAAMLK
ncbi:MAG: hypothetical protein WD851_05920 [Pirellulales bacterium]